MRVWAGRRNSVPEVGRNSPSLCRQLHSLAIEIALASSQTFGSLLFHNRLWSLAHGSAVVGKVEVNSPRQPLSK